MLADWSFVGVFLVVALIFPVLGLLTAWLLRPKRPGPIKKSTYECGLETVGETWIQFKVQYYIYALIFVIFDIEIAFLLPWAVAHTGLATAGGALNWLPLVEVTVFVAILLCGLFYAWRKGALEWI
ncbi:MAG: NADH-quinone oxidoreductase subunit A [Anaerolineae bacterium]|nr:NADH-quinone oxidoreductase subunit A [Anaerolineae bacterium]